MEEINRELTICLAALAGFTGLLRKSGDDLTEAQMFYLVKAEDAAQRAFNLSLRLPQPFD
jgi:hypothetical protein